MTGYFLIILFLDTGVTQKYAFASKAECESVKPAVTRLYEGLRSPVSLECKSRKITDQQIKESVKYGSVTTKQSISIRTSYKF